MITKEEGELKHKDFLLLKFSLTIREDEIFEDIGRITLETEYHIKSEFKYDLGKDQFDKMATTLLHLFYTQYLVSPLSKVQFHVRIKKKEPLKFDMLHFDNRVVDSINDESLLTDREKIQIENFFRQYFPDHKAFKD